MKRSLLIGLFTLITINMNYAQKTEKSKISETIEAFSRAGDNQNADALSKLLDSNYRVVMNRLFGSTEVAVMPRSVYLEKIRSKEFGGDKRKLTIENMVINGNTASAKVTFKGEKMTVVSILMLIQNKDNQWLLTSDVPVII